MRVLVTGGSGRLGRSVVAHLVAEGHDVLNADRAPSPLLTSAHVTVDITDVGQVHDAIRHFRPDAVIHMAGLPTPFSFREAELFRVNAVGTFNVVDSAAEAEVGLVVIAGSPNPVGYGAPGWRPDYLPIDEQHPLRPWNGYNLSKAVGEETLRAALRKNTRLRGFIVRPCFVVTPEDWQDGEVPGGGTIRDRLDDPARGAQSLYNYVDARDAARLFGRILSTAPDIENGAVFYAGAADALAREPLCDLLPRYYPEVGDLAHHLRGTAPAFSIERARRVLDWEPMHSWRTEIMN